METKSEKATDASLRRTAKRLGFRLAKAGKVYQLLEGWSHRPYWPSQPWLSADEIEAFLKTYEKNHGGKADE